jgi:ADP-dependent NAD(P)H-hydrate dehydratase / NAD(P)H-hydrate epimerase
MIRALFKHFPLLPRKKNTDKFRYGHVLVIAGSARMPGAAVLTALAALRAGSGLVTLGFPKNARGVFLKRFAPEMMLLELEATKEGTAAASAKKAIFNYVLKRKVSSVVIGPGLSTHKDTCALVQDLACQLPATVILDADGLNCFRDKSLRLKHRKAALIMTPHQREFQRLFKTAVPEKQSAKVALAKKISTLYDGVLVLKGSQTIVACRDKIFVNRTGNPAMAKGGSGDVLSGIIGAFVAQGLGPFEAAAWAVYFHGRAGDLAVKQKSGLGVLARDLIEFLPEAFLKPAKR